MTGSGISTDFPDISTSLWSCLTKQGPNRETSEINYIPNITPSSDLRLYYILHRCFLDELYLAVGGCRLFDPLTQSICYLNTCLLFYIQTQELCSFRRVVHSTDLWSLWDIHLLQCLLYVSEGSWMCCSLVAVPSSRPSHLVSRALAVFYRACFTCRYSENSDSLLRDFCKVQQLQSMLITDVMTPNNRLADKLPVYYPQLINTVIYTIGQIKQN